MVFKKGDLNYSRTHEVWNKNKGFEEFVGKKFTNLTVIEDVGHITGHRHFRCMCVCGKIIIVDGSKLKNNHTRSCGCIRKNTPQLKHRKTYGEASSNRLISSYIGNSKRRNIKFELTKEQMLVLFKSKCFYCGCDPSAISNSKKCHGEYVYNGIDRLDNVNGYTIENVVSCCKQCNYKKGSQSYDAFLNWIKRVYEYKIMR